LVISNLKYDPSVKTFTNLSREVCSAGRSLGGVRAESDSPDGALVALEGADPVAGVALSKHRLAICRMAWHTFSLAAQINASRKTTRTFACRYHVVAAVHDAAEGQLDDGTRVSAAGQRRLPQVGRHAALVFC